MSLAGARAGAEINNFGSATLKKILWSVNCTVKTKKPTELFQRKEEGKL